MQLPAMNIQPMQNQQGVWAMQFPQQQQMAYQHPDGYYVGRGRGGFRSENRPVAKCYGCGALGHFNKDNLCLPGAREAYMAIQMAMQQGQGSQQMAMQQVQGAQQLAVTGPAATGN